MSDLATLQQQYLAALDADDTDAAAALYDRLPEALRADFDAWLHELTHPEDRAPVSAFERASELERRGMDPEAARLLGTLAAGEVPASVLVDDAITDAGLTSRAVADLLVTDLELGDVPAAAPRVEQAVEHLRTGRNAQIGRLAPRAVEALARVIGVSVGVLQQARAAAARGLGPASPAGALAREGVEDVRLLDERAAADDDAVDELFGTL